MAKNEAVDRSAADESQPLAASPAALPSANEVYEMIAAAAYYRAEKRGFTPGLEADDWVQAEAEVMERLRALTGAT